MRARLNRFALCIAASTADAYRAVEGAEPGLEADTGPRDAFRTLLDRLKLDSQEIAGSLAQPPRSVVARFSFLPYPQRVAFALVVIEEFSVHDAAAIMDLGEDDVRNLLLATREFLFTASWTVRSDA